MLSSKLIGYVPIQRLHPSKDLDFKGHAFEGREGRTGRLLN